MQYAKHIFEFAPSVEETRPDIDFAHSANASIDWLAIGDIVDGSRSDDGYQVPNLAVRGRDACRWHYYSCGGLWLLSKPLMETVRPRAMPRFQFFPALLNSEPYYFVGQRVPLDCLDRIRSRVRYFKSNPGKIMQVDEYQFRQGVVSDPCMFYIEESPGFFVTESVKWAVEEAGLTRGVSFKHVFTFPDAPESQ
jgi:hypothetical protein